MQVSERVKTPAQMGSFLLPYFSLIFGATGIISASIAFLIAIIGLTLIVPGFVLKSGPSRHAINDGYHPTKITSGRFKGKMLMAAYDFKEIEREVYGEPIEAVLAKINKETHSPFGTKSELAQATIERIERELDPICKCGKYGSHYVSGHEALAKKQQAEIEADAQKRRNQAAMSTYDYDTIDDYKYGKYGRSNKQYYKSNRSLNPHYVDIIKRHGVSCVCDVCVDLCGMDRVVEDGPGNVIGFIDNDGSAVLYSTYLSARRQLLTDRRY